MYFASSPGCESGIKLRVYVENITAIPVVTDGESGFDISATDTVKDLQAAIGHISRMLILAQFSTEQRVRSEGILLYYCIVYNTYISVYCCIYICLYIS